LSARLVILFLLNFCCGLYVVNETVLVTGWRCKWWSVKQTRSCMLCSTCSCYQHTVSPPLSLSVTVEFHLDLYDKVVLAVIHVQSVDA